MKSVKSSRQLDGSPARPLCCSRELAPLDRSRQRLSLTAQLLKTQENPKLQDMTLKEFAAFFKKNPNYSKDPKNFKANLSIFSSRKERFLQSHNTTAHPALVRPILKWNPFIESYTPSNDEVKVESKLEKCECELYDSDLNVSRPPVYNSASALKNSIFKESGILYSNQYTMTRKVSQSTMTPVVNDVGCGARQGLRECFKNRATTTMMSRPEARPAWARWGRPRSCEREYSERVYETVVNEPDNCPYERTVLKRPVSYCKSIRSFSQECAFPCDDDEKFQDEDCQSPKERRVTLYNEGISDEIAFNPFYKRKPPPVDLHDDYKVSFGKSLVERDCCDNWIPYSHRGNSKYHQNCLKQQPCRYRADPELRYACPRSLCPPVRTPIWIPPNRCPRKILASEKNIDQYMRGDSKCCRPSMLY